MIPGALFALDRHNLKESDPEYDTRRKKLHVQAKTDPKHLDIIHLTGGTAFPGNGTIYTETLFQIKHELPFIPNCLVYFFIEDAPISDSAFQFIGQYVKNEFYMSGTSGGLTDIIYYNIDDQYFYIKHQFATSPFNPDPQPSTANQFKFKIKYIITSNNRGYKKTYDYISP